jgi:hypothetical protein
LNQENEEFRIHKRIMDYLLSEIKLDRQKSKLSHEWLMILDYLNSPHPTAEMAQRALETYGSIISSLKGDQTIWISLAGATHPSVKSELLAKSMEFYETLEPKSRDAFYFHLLVQSYYFGLLKPPTKLAHFLGRSLPQGYEPYLVNKLHKMGQLLKPLLEDSSLFKMFTDQFLEQGIREEGFLYDKELLQIKMGTRPHSPLEILKPQDKERLRDQQVDIIELELNALRSQPTDRPPHHVPAYNLNPPALH